MQSELGCPSGTSNTTRLKLHSSSPCMFLSYFVSLLSISLSYPCLKLGSPHHLPFSCLPTHPTGHPNPLNFFCSPPPDSVPFSPFLLTLVTKTDVTSKAFNGFPGLSGDKPTLFTWNPKLFAINSPFSQQMQCLLLSSPRLLSTKTSLGICVFWPHWKHYPSSCPFYYAYTVFWLKH